MRFSIITPSFRQKDWLRLCIASVADQVDFPPESPLSDPPFSFTVEHIIQDGGTPGIEAFAREVGADFHRDGVLVFSSSGGKSESGFRGQISESEVPSPPFPSYRLVIYTERDAGMYDAINKGLDRATGEVCAWLNSDEQYLEGALRKVSDVFSREPSLDVLLGDALLTDGKHRPVCYRRIMVPGRWHTRLDHLHSLSCAMFFRKSALPSPPLDPRWKVIGDAILMDYFLGSKKNIRACGRPLAAYSFTGVNLSANPANREHDAWLEEVKWPPGWLRLPVVLHNRLRRMACGAYSSFNVSEGLFTDESGRRRLIVQGSLSGRWPKETGFTQNITE